MSSLIHRFLLDRRLSRGRLLGGGGGSSSPSASASPSATATATVDTEEDGELYEYQPTIPYPTPPPRVAFLCRPGSRYVACQWASWSSGSIAVPLCDVHRLPELRYVLEDCDPDVIIDGIAEEGVDGDDDDEESQELRGAAREAGMEDRVVRLEDALRLGLARNGDGRELEPELGAGGYLVRSLDSPACIMYTSGTTGYPKGVVSTHRNVYHQVTDLVLAWGWTSDDAILHLLPLHHVHGVVNKLCCAVWVGASVEFMKFHPGRVWERLGTPHEAAGESANDGGKEDRDGDGDDDRRGRRRPLTLFMAVPTVYAKMLEILPTLPPDTLSNANATSFRRTVRLCVSGSAALPASVFDRWYELTGQVILERYGMTEFAMALSNPLFPEGGRIPGCVGTPLPSVEVRVVDEDTGEIIPAADADDDNGGDRQDRSGELLVRGPNVFSGGYWNRPESDHDGSFDEDGFFRTGDVAEYDTLMGSYRILGRMSADIIKCGGYKLSAPPNREGDLGAPGSGGGLRSGRSGRRLWGEGGAGMQNEDRDGS